MAIRSLVDSCKKLALGTTHAASITSLFPPVDPAVDGDACLHDCASCDVSYPRRFKVEESDALYGFVKGWSTHVLVATNKADWVRDVEDEKGSVMQALGRAQGPDNGRLMLSASNMPTPGRTSDYSEPTSVLLLPAFVVVENVTPGAVPRLVELINEAPTSSSPLEPLSLPRTLPAPLPAAKELVCRPSPHAALILLCSQKTRDARCGQSAPLIRKELERHLRPLGLFRDLDDERPGGVGVYFISHVGGHKYAANVMVYRRPDAFGLDGVERGKLKKGEEVRPVKRAPRAAVVNGNGQGHENGNGKADVEKGEVEEEEEDVGAAQCIWLARVRPEDCENLVRYTVLQGKVVKPDRQLRGGFDRGKGLMSW